MDVRQVQLRELCGVRSGDKGDRSDLTLFADSEEVFDLLVDQVTPQRVTAHFGDLLTGDVTRYLVPNVLAVKFVLDGCLGGGGAASLRSDALGKTLGGALLRLRVEAPADLVARCTRAGRRAPLAGAVGV